MFVVKDSVHIDAPMERVFLLSTSVELVRLTLGMRPVAGRVTGCVVAGDQVEWRGWKFGLPTRHVSVISGYEAPEFFQDTQLTGRFARFQHDHHLQWVGGQVFAHDKVKFSLPFGVLGKVVAKRVMVPYVARLLARRFALLKRVAEGEEWRAYLEGGAAGLGNPTA
jgi:ligand-binding SRPBCC domain-containing protein